MRAIFVPHFEKDTYEINFTHEMPLLPKDRRTTRCSAPKSLISRTTDLEDAAEASASINVGKISFEMIESRVTFRQFFLDLITLDGLELLVTGNRYSLTIKVGRCFDPEPICIAVAQCVQRQFYPEEELVCESQLELQSPLIPKKKRKKLNIREVPDDE
jgi:hypothetical protein